MKNLQQIITIGVIIIIVLVIAYSYRKTREPFQTNLSNPVVVSNITSNPDEIFLVAPNPAEFKINSPSDSFSYSSTG